MEKKIENICTFPFAQHLVASSEVDKTPLLVFIVYKCPFAIVKVDLINCQYHEKCKYQKKVKK